MIDTNKDNLNAEVELSDKKMMGASDANPGIGKKTSVMSNMTESGKAAALYTYGVTPTFYRGQFSKDQQERPTNKRKSTRYTWPTFFPIAFGLQFKKLVNIFYIITGILNMFRTIQVNSPIVVLVPTFLIMMIGVTKEFVSELKRY